MDRTLVQEFPSFFAVGDNVTGVWTMSPSTDYRPLNTTDYPNANYWVSEHKLDLSGYVQSDLTVGFRRSFEQESGYRSINWNANRDNQLDPYDAAVGEQIIVSSVPFTDDQLIFTTLGAPGFIPLSTLTLPPGNFNRTHIIHGHGSYFDIELNQIVDPSEDSSAFLQRKQEWYYSSLEPTAADCLYCYRLLVLPNGAAADAYGATGLVLPALRVILDAFTVEEPTLEYMMRLKRSYELANQV